VAQDTRSVTPRRRWASTIVAGRVIRCCFQEFISRCSRCSIPARFSQFCRSYQTTFCVTPLPHSAPFFRMARNNLFSPMLAAGGQLALRSLPRAASAPFAHGRPYLPSRQSSSVRPAVESFRSPGWPPQIVEGRNQARDPAWRRLVCRETCLYARRPEVADPPRPSANCRQAKRWGAKGILSKCMR
jgi:hypothetical protein